MAHGARARRREVHPARAAGAPAHDDATAEQIRALVSKGAGGGWLAFTTDDVEAAYARVEDAGADITQDVVTQPYGRDFALRDPSGNAIRIGELY